MQSLVLLGRQPALGLAELESLYGATKVRMAGDQAAVIDVDPCLLAFDRLGGAMKFCKVLLTLEATGWREIENFLVQAGAKQSQTMPEGKMQLGLSAVGFNVTIRQMEATGLTMKKAIRRTGRSVRLVPNKELELSTAQVIHNHLTGPMGWEIVLIRDGDQTIIAQTVKIQDIASYAYRDRDRPKRDAKVGMLPPKLAQIILNLAAGQLPADKLVSICDIPAGATIPRPQLGQRVLDPFCGTGVVLQEARLMGYDAYGTDLESRMIDYTQANLNWLDEQYQLEPVPVELSPGDATAFTWSAPIDLVATETYLGKPFTSKPDAEVLAQTVSDCNLIIKKFLRNLHAQVKPGTRLCVAVPAWRIGSFEFKFLPLVDQIEDLGYNRISFEHTGNDQLIYHRPDQFVARQLLVLTTR